MVGAADACLRCRRRDRAQAQPASSRPATAAAPSPSRSSSSAPTRSSTTATPTSSPRAARCGWTREGNYLAADQVIWNRKTGEVRAQGNVVLLTPQGDKLVGDNVVLTDTLRDGTVDNLLVVLESGGRIAAQRGSPQRRDHHARECDLLALPGDHRRPAARKRPSWAITAARVIDDPAQQRSPLRGRAAPAVRRQPSATAGFQHLARQRRARPAGWFPTSASSTQQGLRARRCPITGRSGRTATSRSRRTSTPACLPAIEAKYRELEQPRRVPARRLPHLRHDRQRQSERTRPTAQRHPRLFRRQRQVPARSRVEHHQLAPGGERQDRHPPLRHHQRRPAAQLSSTPSGSAPTATSRSPAGRSRACAPTTCRSRSRSPFRRSMPASASNDVARRARSSSRPTASSIIRIEGQDTQRAFASARWDLRRLTPWGQELTLTAYGRGDVYHTDDAASTAVPIYRGTDGWHARAIGALAADVQWPFVGPLFGGIQRLVAARPAGADAADAEPRHPQRGRALGRPRGQQPVRAQPLPRLRPVGGRLARHLRPRLVARSRRTCRSTAPSGRAIGSARGAEFSRKARALTTASPTSSAERASATAGSSTSPTATASTRDNFAVRRNEVDLTVGTTQTYAQIGYLQAQPRTSIRRSRICATRRSCGSPARVKFARYWSIFGATVIDLTDKSEDPLSLADGWQPVRNRLGIAI